MTPVATFSALIGTATPPTHCAASRQPRRGAFIFSKANGGGGVAVAPPLPCHISFLWTASNEALAGLLAPLLPLAKALGLFVLDFDVYLENRDAQRTADQVVPAVRRFFLANSAHGG